MNFATPARYRTSDAATVNRTRCRSGRTTGPSRRGGIAIHREGWSAPVAPSSLQRVLLPSLSPSVSGKENASILATSIGGTLIQRNSSRRCVPSPCSRRPAHPLGGERYRRRAWQCAGAPYLVEYGFGVGADFFGDKRESGRLGSTAIFDRCADHSAGISDEIGEDEHAAGGERPLGLHRAWNVGALGDEPGLQPPNIVGVDDIGPRCGDPNIARDVDDRVHAELAAARMIVQC